MTNETQVIANEPKTFFAVVTSTRYGVSAYGKANDTYDEALKYAAELVDDESYDEVFVVQALALVGEPKKPVTVTKLV